MQEKFTYNGKTYTYDMNKSKRKRISIVVTREGKILVKLPLTAAYEEGRRFVYQKRKWIVQHQKKILEEKEKQGLNKSSAHTFLEGDIFYYRGKPCFLHIRENASSIRVRIEKCKDQIVLSGPPLTVEQKKQIIEEWFRRLAKIRLEERCQYYAKILHVHYQTIRVKNQKTRWGSCSSKCNLNFNWKLIMAEDDVLDYVVIHELCHLKEMNHSPTFWALVKSVMPDYKEKERWLKEHQEDILAYE